MIDEIEIINENGIACDIELITSIVDIVHLDNITRYNCINEIWIKEGLESKLESEVILFYNLKLIGEIGVNSKSTGIEMYKMYKNRNGGSCYYSNH